MFRHLMICIRSDLSATMPHFFTDKDDASHDHEESSSVSKFGKLPEI